MASQIRALVRQLGHPLFLRYARGVTPTAIGDELAHKMAPQLAALTEITEAGLDRDSVTRTLHLAGPPEFLAERALPALPPLIAQGLSIRTVFGSAEELLTDLSCGHHDLTVTTARPRGELLTATPLCDEEHVLIAAPLWADLGRCVRGRAGAGSRTARRGPREPAADRPLLVHDLRRQARGVRCGPISWPYGPGHSGCRISRGRRNGCCGPPSPGEREAWVSPGPDCGICPL